jgi:dCTP deaminase
VPLRHEELQAAMAAPIETALIVTPILDPRQVGSASIDLRLGTEFLFLRRLDQSGLDPGKKEVRPERLALHDRVQRALGRPVWLHPGQFLLGSTMEFVRMPRNLSGLVVGRSSWARIGLIVEAAGLVQPGYAGTLTYQLANMGDSPVALYPGLPVAQLVISDLRNATGHADLPVTDRFPAKYNAALGPEPSRLAWEETEMDTLLQVGSVLGSARTKPTVRAASVASPASPGAAAPA